MSDFEYIVEKTILTTKPDKNKNNIFFNHDFI